MRERARHTQVPSQELGVQGDDGGPHRHRGEHAGEGLALLIVRLVAQPQQAASGRSRAPCFRLLRG